jgi:hypothetical protein
MAELDVDIGWATDIAVHELSGASMEDLGDHLVVRSPLNPTLPLGELHPRQGAEAADQPER